MEKLSEFARSMNETHRICTHEISGHLHLLRFCIDELVEDPDSKNPLVKKLEEGITSLEDLNKLWKICTRSINPENEMSFEAICERGVGLGILYNQKFIKEISHTESGNFNVPLGKGVILVEALYAAVSAISHFAVQNQQHRLELEVTGLKSDDVKIEICGKVNKALPQKSVPKPIIISLVKSN